MMSSSDSSDSSSSSSSLKLLPAATLAKATEYYGSKTYYVQNSKAAVVAVNVDDSGDYSAPSNFLAGCLDGYYFAPLGDGSPLFGPEELISGLGTLGLDDINKDFKDSSSSETFAFSYGFYDGTSFLTIEASFRTDAAFVLTTATVKVSEYGSVSFIKDDELGTYSLVDGAVANKSVTYSIGQSVGERKEVCPFDVDTFLKYPFFP